MNPFSEQSDHDFGRFDSATPSHELPAEFEADLHRVDALIAHAAEHDRQTSIPEGLNQRVISASASLLPQQAMRSSRKPLVTAASGSNPFSFARFSLMLSMSRMTGMTGGRLAMAAMVLLAFGIGAMMMHTSNVNPNDPLRVAASGGTGRTPTETGNGGGSAGMLASVSLALVATPGSVDEVSDQVSYLLETDDLNSLDDVRNEMSRLLASLDM